MTFSHEKVISKGFFNPTIYHTSVVKQRRPARSEDRGANNREWDSECVEAKRLRETFPLSEESLLGSVKEVIQPQVPLRLPCYDFAPVTALAFGRLAPCGFRHGLRALTASMA